MTAVASTPLLCKTFRKTKAVTEGETKDPYAGKLFQGYKQFLLLSIKFRWVTIGVSRLIPVAMTAGTTILGMLPLLTDAFFVSMAVTIMFGLGFAIVLTLIVVRVLYAIFFKVPYQAPLRSQN